MNLILFKDLPDSMGGNIPGNMTLQSPWKHRKQPQGAVDKMSPGILPKTEISRCKVHAIDMEELRSQTHIQKQPYPKNLGGIEQYFNCVPPIHQRSFCMSIFLH